MQSISPKESPIEPPPKKRLLTPGSEQNPSENPSMSTQSRIAMPLDSGISYKPIFQSSHEIPAFFPTYRWWEDEATTVFWAFEIEQVSRVIRFGLFHDENFPRTSLCARNPDTIDTFLVALSEAHEYQNLGNLSHIQRVEEILRRSSIPRFQAIPWSWFPHQSSLTLDPLAIAMAIETESHFHFRQIAFEELVRAALGYNAISVQWFLQQHTALYIIIINHLQAYPGDISLYADVETHLRLRSPFAHRALYHSLLAVRPGGYRDIPQPKPTGFEFAAGPIQSLFKKQVGSLANMLKTLSVLGIRFRRQYHHAAAMNWMAPFDTSIPFLEDCLTASSPTELADNISYLDEHRFAEITTQSLLIDETAVKLQLHWQALTISVWECCCALPELIPTLQECAQSLLKRRKNYHSLMAILNGLRDYTISKMPNNVGSSPGAPTTLEALIPAEVVSLIDPVGNYHNYLQFYKQFPGIPFLTPHIRDYEQNGNKALQPVIQYLNDLPGQQPA